MEVKYMVKPGESLSSIAIKFGVPISLIIEKNPFLLEGETLYGGEQIFIPEPEEVMEKILGDADKQIDKKEEVTENKLPTNQIIPEKTITVDWGNLSFKKGQLGVAFMVRDSVIYKIEKKDTVKEHRKMKVNSSYRVYGETEINGGMFYVGGGQYILKKDSYFMPLPPDKVKELEDKTNKKPGTSQTTPKDEIKVPDLVPPKLEEKPTIPDPSNYTMPQMTMSGYRRSRLRFTMKDGKYKTVELRVLSVNRGRTNQYAPTRTNAGWSVHVGGAGLTVLTVSGFFLDTLSNRERDDYDVIYNQYIKPKSNDKYFESPLVTFVHKGVEYKGFIQSDNSADDSNTPLYQSFNFTFLVMTERILRSTDIAAQEFAIDRKKQDEITFLSDLSNMLKNPITGGEYNG